MSAKLGTPRTEHIGLRITKEMRNVLDVLVANEQERVGHVAHVTATSMIEALIVQEAERRALKIPKTAAPPKKR